MLRILTQKMMKPSPTHSASILALGLACLSPCSFADTKIADSAANFGASSTLRTPDGVLEVVGGTVNKPTLVIRGASNNTDIGQVSDTTAPPNLIVQQNGNVGIGTTNAQAKLDVRGEVKVGNTSLTCSSNTTGAIRNVSGIMQFCNGTTWGELRFSTLGNIKYSALTADHDGWILLDGRAKTTLTAAQQTNATTLGIGTNLPNAANRVLMQTGTVFSTGGSNSVTLTQANLPNVNFTGSTSTDGAHTHTISRRSNPDNGAFDSGDGRAGESSAATTDRAVLGTFSTSSNGTHTHTVTVSSGGSGTAINTTPAFLSVNTFIYLGNL